MPEEPIDVSQRGRLGRGWRLIAGYEPISARDHWVDAVTERVMPPLLLAVLGIGLSILGWMFSAPMFALPGTVLALVAAILVVRTWRSSTAEWRRACTQDRAPFCD